MSGVVHVGLNAGHDDIDRYMRERALPILAFEPLASRFQQDYESYAALSMADLLVIESLALSDRDGRAVLRVPKHIQGGDDHQSASLHAVVPTTAQRIGWTVTDVRDETVTTMRFDSYARAVDLDMALFDQLVVDVQGHELQVLKGFGVLMGSFSRLRIECSEEPVYDGGATTAEVGAYLCEYGYRRVSPIVPHGDVLFVKP